MARVHPRPARSLFLLEKTHNQSHRRYSHHCRNQPSQPIAPVSIHILSHDFFVVADQENEDHERWCEEAVEDSAVVEDFEGRNAGEVDEEAGKRGDGDDAVEAVSLFEFEG